MSVPAVDEARRSRLRTAIGAEDVEAILASAQVMDYAAPWRIPLHESGIFEDLRHFWLRRPVLALFDGVDRVEALDFGDDAVVGKSLRPAVGDLGRACEEVADLVGFFARIRPVRWLEMLDETACDGLMAAWLLIESLIAVTDDAAAAAASSYAEIKQHVTLYRRFLESTQYGAAEAMGVDQQIDSAQEIALLFDIPDVPTGYEREYDFYRSLEAQGHELGELAARQLGYLGQYFPVSRDHADEYAWHAIRLGQSAYPLLAHRASQLAIQLVRDAQAVDAPATSSLIRTFFREEAELIRAAGRRFHAAFEKYRSEDDRTLVVDAYHTLAEGPFRRFGSLLVALSEIAAGRPAPTPFLLPYISDVEDRLGKMPEPIGDLLLEFVDRDLRNADAHANVVLLASGMLSVRLADGSHVTVVANHVYGKAAGLRSTLNGVDTAINLTHSIDHISSPYEPPKMSTVDSIATIGNKVANDFTSGSIVDADADGVVKLHFSGTATDDQIEAMLSFLDKVPMIDEIRVIRIIDTRGQTLGELARSSPTATAA